MKPLVLVSLGSSVPIFLALTSCGAGGGGGATSPLVVVSMQFVDASGERVHEIEGGKIPRNARVEITFNQAVDPSSVGDPALHIAPGPTASPELGLVRVDGARVTFDPTVVASGLARPLGLRPDTTYLVSLPSGAPSGLSVRAARGGELAVPFTSSFSTGRGFILEAVRPRLVSAAFSSGSETTPGTVVAAHASVTLRFSEAIEPSSLGFSVSTPTAKAGEGVDIRYATGVAANAAAGIEGVPVLGAAQVAPTLDRVTFYPSDSFGDAPYVFSISVLWGIRDLAGNTLENPTLLGPFTCDARGGPVPAVLGESFLDTADRDSAGTTADWNGTQAGVLRGAALTSRRARVTAAGLHARGALAGPGQYVAHVDPLMGAALNAVVGGINPPTSLGRRVMWSFSDDDIGPSGAITSVAWGPDSNATFAATYPEVVLRFGQKATPSLDLATTFSANYAGQPFVAYDGPYAVAQHADVGNETVPFTAPAGAGYAALAPLFAYTGFQAWPALTSYFEWDAGTPTGGDSTLLFDASVTEGSTWQQLRGWYGVNAVAPVGLVLSPNRRLFATFGEDQANPPTGPAIQNPEPSLSDTAFTLVRRSTVAQSRFYTPGPTDPAGNSYPGPDSAAHTFGVKSDYAPAVLSPSVHPGSVVVEVEYQAAAALDPLSDRLAPDLSQAVTPWTTNVNDCDGYPYLRWRLRLVSDIDRNEVAQVDSVAIPVRRLP